jgi:peptide chain release factor
VNKVETGVRAIYPPTGDVTVCTDERSQYANKKKALTRLEALVNNRNVEEKIESANDMRISHVNLERGNAVAKFEGMNFKRVY